jgi:uncharacterized protein
MTNHRDRALQRKFSRNNFMDLCIYHADCADGFGAALVVYSLHGDLCEYIPAHYGDSPPDVTGKDVIIVDFSFKRMTLLNMKVQAKSLIVLDHHKTAESELKNLAFCKFDMDRSGAVMAWEYLFPGKDIPMLLRYIEDRDLWRWSLGHSKAVSAYLSSIERDFAIWEQLLCDSYLLSCIRKGESILGYQDQCVKRALSAEPLRMKICGYDVPALNVTHLISETIGRLAEGEPFGVGYFDTSTHRIFSLRSCDGSVDVSEVAKRMGGGGHERAAGFKLEHGSWNDMIFNKSLIP